MTNNGKSQGVKFGAAGLLITLGIVFGDIGTSPLYVIKAILRDSVSVREEFHSGNPVLRYLDTDPSNHC